MNKHIQTASIHQLRSETGLTLMQAKKCLQENNWIYNDAKKSFRDYQWPGKLIYVTLNDKKISLVDST